MAKTVKLGRFGFYFVGLLEPFSLLILRYIYYTTLIIIQSFYYHYPLRWIFQKNIHHSSAANRLPKTGDVNTSFIVYLGLLEVMYNRVILGRCNKFLSTTYIMWENNTYDGCERSQSRSLS
jgi:hypothetical protein